MKVLATERGFPYTFERQSVTARVRARRDDTRELDPTFDKRNQIPFPRGGTIRESMSPKMDRIPPRPTGPRPPKIAPEYRGSVFERLQSTLGNKEFGQLLDGMAKATRNRRTK